MREILDKIMRVLNAAIMAFLTILVVWQVATRYLLNNPSTWSEELTSYMFSWVTLMGAAYVFGKRDHMNIPILVDRLSKKNQLYLDIFIQVLNLGFAATVMVYGGYEITKLTMGQMSSSLSISMGYFYMIIPISGLFIVIYSILNIRDSVQKQKVLQKEGA